MEKEVYKIGEVAKILVTSIRTIRYYEEELLIKPIRTDKGTRLYSKSHIKRLKAILQLVRNGFSIEMIRKISSLREECATGKESSSKLATLLDNTSSNIEQQITKLESIKYEIKLVQQIIKSCNSCNNIPSTKGCPNCLVIKQLDKILLLNLIWE
ncbi:MAG: MerR family transcriptional regulator [Candidatus Marithrix sp.]|nr:MerR family transcriptional regulator [Candidatus Marithrix sp.]